MPLKATFGTKWPNYIHTNHNVDLTFILKNQEKKFIYYKTINYNYVGTPTSMKAHDSRSGL